MEQGGTQGTRAPRARLARSPQLWITAVYLATWWVLAPGLWINDNGVKLIQTRAILDSGLSDFSVAWPGERIDPEHHFQPIPAPLGIVRDGKLFASYPPTFALLAAGASTLLGRAGLALWPLAGALLLLPAVAGLARRVQGEGSDPAAAAAAVWLVGLGTPVWFYAGTFWEHTLSICLAAWCLLAVLRFRERPDASSGLAVGSLAAAGVWLRTDAYLFAGVVAAACLARRGAGARPRATLLAGLILGLGALWTLQATTVGHPLGLHLQSQQWSALGAADWLAMRGEVASRLLLNCHPRMGLSALVGGLFWAGLALRPRLATPGGAWWVAGAALASVLTAVTVLSGIFTHERPMVALAEANGLFAAAPFAVFSFLRRPDEGAGAAAARRTLLGTIVLLAVLYAGLAPRVNAVGLHWGCRFLLAAYPLLAALAGPTLVHAWRRWPGTRLIVFAALAAALALQCGGIALLGARKAFDARLEGAVAASRPPAIVTDVWFLPALLAEGFHRQPILLAIGPRRVDEALRALARGGIAEALVITGEPVDPTPSRDPEVLSDGWPGLVALRLRRLPTAPRATTHAPGAGGGS